MEEALQRGLIANGVSGFMGSLFCPLLRILPTAPSPERAIGHLLLIRHYRGHLSEGSPMRPQLGVKKMHRLKTQKMPVEERALNC